MQCLSSVVNSIVATTLLNIFYLLQVVAKKIKNTNNSLNKHNVQCTKDNKKWCDLATLTNVYNSDNIHFYRCPRYITVSNERLTLL